MPGTDDYSTILVGTASPSEIEESVSATEGVLCRQTCIRPLRRWDCHSTAVLPISVGRGQ